MTKKTIQLRVYRYNPQTDTEPKYQTYKVPYEPGMTGLDALLYIQDNLDGTLAFRWSCRQASCGSCAVLVNGTPKLLCRTNIPEETEVLTITPLLHYPVIKDLVVDLTRGMKKMQKIRPYILRSEKIERPEIITKEEIALVKELRQCIECWACISACPTVSEAYYEFSGPLIMRQLARLEFDKRDIEDRIAMAFADGVYDCTTCGACKAVCPYEIDIPRKAIEKLRAGIVNRGLGPLEGQQIFIDFINKTGRAVTKLEDAPPFLEGLPDAMGPNTPVDEVIFFTGCLMDFRLQQTAESVVKILTELGVRVYLPKEQECCASPALRSGDVETAKRQVITNIQVLDSFEPKKVITACAGCGVTLKLDYPELAKHLGIDPPHFKTYDFIEYLLEEFGMEKLKEKMITPVKKKITYHYPCHLSRGQGISEEPIDILKQIPGVEYVELNDADRCCGAGGGVRAGKRDLSMLMARRKGENIIKSGADAVCTSDCPFCTIQARDILSQLGSKIQTYFLPDLLAEAFPVK
ncbi:MAG: fumarate reductase (CoM/CoB) subunit TfrB [Candidatus Hodarchaeota archaeon]